MALRILLFGIGLWIGYVFRRWSLRRGASAPSLLQVVASGCVLLLASWAAWQLIAWLFFLPRSLLAYAPFDAFMVGMAAGWILADHQIDSDQAGAAAPQARSHPTREGHAAASTVQAPATYEAPRSGLDWLSPLTSAARTTVTSLGLLILTVLGLAPPHFWSQVFDRLEGFKAAGLEFTLGTATGQNVAQSILASATGTEALGTNSRQERHGFISERLQRVHTLTHPHDPEKASATALLSNPTVLLYTQAQALHQRLDSASDNRADGVAREAAQGRLPPPRDIARDRALLLHLHLGAEATDTRRRPLSGPSQRLAGELKELAKAQEQFLARLASHVACISEVVGETSDRRLLEYQTARVVEELYLVARLWSSLEKEHTRRHLTILRSRMWGIAETPAGRARDELDDGIKKAEKDLENHARTLGDRLYDFTVWADDTIAVWRAARPQNGRQPQRPADSSGDEQAVEREWRVTGLGPPPPAVQNVSGQPGDIPIATGGGSHQRGRREPPRDRPPVSKHCDYREPNVGAPLQYVIRTLKRTDSLNRSELERSGFAPYLTIFVAQALSAMGDHIAALRMLVTWQKDLKELIALAKGDTPIPQNAGWVIGAPRRDTDSSGQIEHFLLAAEWFELMTFVETLIVQNLSENTEFALPPTEEAAHHVVTRLFPAVFARISQDTSLRDWRGSTILSCRRPTNIWRQTLALSYASLVKNYLDLRNRNLIQPDDITIADIEFADMLMDLNLECFPDEIKPDEISRQRAIFALSATAIKLNLLVTKRINSDKKHELQQSLQNSIQRTLRELQRSKPSGESATELEHLVFAREDGLLSSAKSIKARLDNLAGR